MLFLIKSIVIGLILISLNVAASDIPKSSKVLRVGAVVGYPFVEVDPKTGARGISVAIIKDIAARNGWRISILPTEQSQENAIQDMIDGKYDLLIGAISVTADRIKKVEFSRPFFIAEGKLAVNRHDISYWQNISDLSKSIPTELLVFVSLLIIGVAHLIWWSERKMNSEMPSQYLRGIGYSFWFFITHFFKGGLLYRPRSNTARVILMLWLIIALCFFLVITSTYTAFITAKVIDSSHSSINVNHLRGAKIAYEKNKPYRYFPRTVGGIGIEVDSMKEGLLLVQNRKVYAAIGDQLLMEDALHKINAPEVTITASKFSSDEYAMVFPIGSAYLRPTNISLVEMRESAELMFICKLYLGTKFLNCDL